MNALLKRLSALLAVFTIAFSAGVFLPGCENDAGNGDTYEDMQEGAEETGDQIQEGAEDMGDQVQQGAENLGDKAEDMTD